MIAFIAIYIVKEKRSRECALGIFHFVRVFEISFKITLDSIIFLRNLFSLKLSAVFVVCVWYCFSDVFLFFSRFGSLRPSVCRWYSLIIGLFSRRRRCLFPSLLPYETQKFLKIFRYKDKEKNTTYTHDGELYEIETQPEIKCLKKLDIEWYRKAD